MASDTLRRVPPETVCEIFALTLRYDEEDMVRKPPWQLGHICQSWRLAALGYPPLWNSISILPPSHGFLLPMIEIQLLRSANGPLDVYYWSADAEEGAVDLQCASVVVAHCRRWRSLHLNIPYTLEELSWLYPVEGRLDGLERLKVLGCDPTAGIGHIFAVAPRLRDVILTDSQFVLRSAIIAIPWGQITHYRGTHNAQTQLDILKQAPNLLQCAVSLKLGPDYDPERNSPALLPHLRRLCIAQPRLLDGLKAPRLEELCCLRNWRMDIHALLPFVHNSSCSLTTLVLMSCGICPELVEVLHDLPSLTYVLIESPDERHGQTGGQYEHTVALFEALTISGTPVVDALCPALASFVFGFSPEFPHDTFFLMARSRFTLGRRLTSLRVFGYDAAALDVSSLLSIRGFSTMARPLPSLPALESCPPSILAPIQMLREDGFDVAFIGRRDVDLLKASWI
ncbi:hypothetical protein DFH08DRAFT_344777 [Mycena albidolilacea]|uniref:F-box domain-containing protein n=1 Tax=Mycena albidolilacea TaxID=1033008 RepID=A0AAD6ZJI1_9AGAR|nr:hypothetical protein DFH08DRAFT_344777 [Mycena albidolilacea]